MRVHYSSNQIKINRAGSSAHNTKKIMKEKILIIGRPGTGKSRMAQRLAIAMGYKVIDEITGIEELKKRATPNTIYVSNAIDEQAALWHLEDFTIIKLIIA